ncbi:MAG: hypothetical protein LAT62_05825 [Natronospirillum sp.]|uniref:hypothetical protein n=1 Tax=Natronospirillum sp. TaxID=2812955 RepID=UPI00260114F5|nr:hypothetical protein [Natronospirillum sp.]MCH8551435.1 hypothetical protein [Natronospirillum sp.]
MSNGLINSLINPGMKMRGNVSAPVQPVPPVQEASNRVREPEQTPELPRPVNRSGPVEMQAMSQYEAFSAQSLAGAGSGFNAIV